MTTVDMSLNDDSSIDLTVSRTASAVRIVVNFRTSDYNEEISFRSSSMPVVRTGTGR